MVNTRKHHQARAARASHGTRLCDKSGKHDHSKHVEVVVRVASIFIYSSIDWGWDDIERDELVSSEMGWFVKREVMGCDAIKGCG